MPALTVLCQRITRLVTTHWPRPCLPHNVGDRGQRTSARKIPAIMPQPGDVCPGFMADAGRCAAKQLVYDRNLQARAIESRPEGVPVRRVSGRYRTWLNGTSGQPNQRQQDDPGRELGLVFDEGTVSEPVTDAALWRRTVGAAVASVGTCGCFDQIAAKILAPVVVAFIKFAPVRST